MLQLMFISVGNNCIVVYQSLTGEPVTCLGYGGLLESPSRLATDETGLIYICDTNNQRIQVFHDTSIKTLTY